MNYQIRWGDTLSGLAARHGTTVAALMQANPYVKNANLIYAGKNLVIPGSKDEFVSSKSANPSPAMYGSNSFVPASKDPFQIAKSLQGRNAGELKLASNVVGIAMEDWVPNNVNCANFVSACLQAAGQISKSQHSNSVYGLQGNLDKDPDFKRISLANAKPGDVVCMKTNGGQHVVMFAGWQNGKPMFIGSNNVNADGSQKVTISSMNYPIMSVHTYVG
jgi:LysM repeat protein